MKNVFFKKNRPYRWGPVLFYYSLIFFLSSFSDFDPQLKRLIINDKLIHFCEFFILGFLLARGALWNDVGRLNHLKWWSVCFVLLALSAFLDEFHQSFVPHRSVDFFDGVADVLGGMTGIFFYRFWNLSSLRKQDDTH